jgi:hypothetical protein
MPIFRRLLGVSLLAWLGGCGNSVPMSPAPPSPLTPKSYVVSGILFEEVDGGSRPLPGRQVRLFNTGTCGQSTPGDCRIEKEDVFRTDDNGRYTAVVPSGSRVFVYARGPAGTLQPCIATAVVDEDTTIDVQVAPAGSSLTPPLNASSMITGFVYETTSQGRKPLRDVGAWLEVGFGDSYVVALTQTDEAGRFFLCRVNVPVRMGVSSYQEWFQSIPGTGDLSFEIELKR